MAMQTRISEIEDAIATKPDDMEQYIALSRLYHRAGDKEKCSSLLDDARKRFPDQFVFTWLVKEFEHDRQVQERARTDAKFSKFSTRILPEDGMVPKRQNTTPVDVIPRYLGPSDIRRLAAQEIKKFYRAQTMEQKGSTTPKFKRLGTDQEIILGKKEVIEEPFTERHLLSSVTLVFLVGPPGAGKKQLCSRLHQDPRLDFKHVDLGKVLEGTSKNRATRLGQLIREAWKERQSVDDTVVMSLFFNALIQRLKLLHKVIELREHLKSTSHQDESKHRFRIVVDGFPRNELQWRLWLEHLEENNIKEDSHFVVINCPADVCKQRLLKEVTACKHRTPDISKRLNDYMAHTQPFLENLITDPSIKSRAYFLDADDSNTDVVYDNLVREISPLVEGFPLQPLPPSKKQKNDKDENKVTPHKQRKSVSPSPSSSTAKKEEKKELKPKPPSKELEEGAQSSHRGRRTQRGGRRRKGGEGTGNRRSANRSSSSRRPKRPRPRPIPSQVENNGSTGNETRVIPETNSQSSCSHSSSKDSTSNPSDHQEANTLYEGDIQFKFEKLDKTIACPSHPHLLNKFKPQHFQCDVCKVGTHRGLYRCKPCRYNMCAQCVLDALNENPDEMLQGARHCDMHEFELADIKVDHKLNATASCHICNKAKFGSGLQYQCQNCLIWRCIPCTRKKSQLRLVFSTPTESQIGPNVNFTSNPVLSLLDSDGKSVTFVFGEVTLSLSGSKGTQPRGRGKLYGRTRRYLRNGQADFSGSNLSISDPGTYHIQATFRPINAPNIYHDLTAWSSPISVGAVTRRKSTSTSGSNRRRRGVKTVEQKSKDHRHVFRTFSSMSLTKARVYTCDDCQRERKLVHIRKQVCRGCGWTRCDRCKNVGAPVAIKFTTQPDVNTVHALEELSPAPILALVDEKNNPCQFVKGEIRLAVSGPNGTTPHGHGQLTGRIHRRLEKGEADFSNGMVMFDQPGQYCIYALLITGGKRFEAWSHEIRVQEAKLTPSKPTTIVSPNYRKRRRRSARRSQTPSRRRSQTPSRNERQSSSSSSSSPPSAISDSSPWKPTRSPRQNKSRSPSRAPRGRSTQATRSPQQNKKDDELKQSDSKSNNKDGSDSSEKKGQRMNRAHHTRLTSRSLRNKFDNNDNSDKSMPYRGRRSTSSTSDRDRSSSPSRRSRSRSPAKAPKRGKSPISNRKPKIPKEGHAGRGRSRSGRGRSRARGRGSGASEGKRRNPPRPSLVAQHEHEYSDGKQSRPGFFQCSICNKKVSGRKGHFCQFSKCPTSLCPSCFNRKSIINLEWSLVPGNDSVAQAPFFYQPVITVLGGPKGKALRKYDERISIEKASGPGNLCMEENHRCRLSKTERGNVASAKAVHGVVHFHGLYFDQPGTYTLVALVRGGTGPITETNKEDPEKAGDHDKSNKKKKPLFPLIQVESTSFLVGKAQPANNAFDNSKGTSDDLPSTTKVNDKKNDDENTQTDRPSQEDETEKELDTNDSKTKKENEKEENEKKWQEDAPSLEKSNPNAESKSRIPVLAKQPTALSSTSESQTSSLKSSPTKSNKPADLVFIQQPSQDKIALAKEPFSVQPIVAVHDSSGQVVTSYTGMVTVSKPARDSGGGRLLGSPLNVACIDGVADFKNSNLAISEEGTHFITASTSTFPAISIKSQSFIVMNTAPTRLRFITQPSNDHTHGEEEDETIIAPNEPISVVVQIQDTQGRVCAQCDDVVELYRLGPQNSKQENLSLLAHRKRADWHDYDNARILLKSVSCTNGVADFGPDLVIDYTGRCVLEACVKSVKAPPIISRRGSGGLERKELPPGENFLKIKSNPFRISSEGPIKMIFTTQPVSATVNKPLRRPIVVLVQDDHGKGMTDFNGSVSLAVLKGPPTGAFVGNAVMDAKHGVASFRQSDHYFDTAGEYILEATCSFTSGSEKSDYKKKSTLRTRSEMIKVEDDENATSFEDDNVENSQNGQAEEAKETSESSLDYAETASGNAPNSEEDKQEKKYEDQTPDAAEGPSPSDINLDELDLDNLDMNVDTEVKKTGEESNTAQDNGENHDSESSGETNEESKQSEDVDDKANEQGKVTVDDDVNGTSNANEELDLEYCEASLGGKHSYSDGQCMNCSYKQPSPMDKFKAEGSLVIGGGDSCPATVGGQHEYKPDSSECSRCGELADSI